MSSDEVQSSGEEVLSSDPEHEPLVEEPVTPGAKMDVPHESSAEEVFSGDEVTSD